ncbi:MAG: pyridoxal phosphate-dependent aminotransferase [Chloroflexi bacterium]|nr:pyridoxal phosphate-dependent aminotransferase [Chloroflexota bacterium]
MTLKPQYSVKEEELIPIVDYPQHTRRIPTSRMFLIKKALKTYTDSGGTQTYDASQGDGGASLPGVPAEVLDRAHELQLKKGTAYGSPAGEPEYRQAVAENYWHLDSSLSWGPANIVAGQGGRDVLIKVFQAMIDCGYGRVGDALLVSAVPWISYNWGPYGVGLNVLRAAGDPNCAWEIDEQALTETVKFAESTGRKPAGLVITSPDNPTGRTMPLERQIALAKSALAQGVRYVLFDWIYHWVSEDEPHDINDVLREFTPEERNQLMFLDGITKSLGGSNIRNCHLIASEDVCNYITSRSSHGVIVSFYSQAVAMAAYEMGFEKVAAVINEPTNASRRIVQDFVAEKGLQTVIGNGYYAFINVEKWIKDGGYEDSIDFGQHLAEQYGVAVVPGAFFSQAGKYWIRFSYAQAPELAKGATERFWEGLHGLANG